MRGDRWRARCDGDRHSRAAALSEKNGAGVGDLLATGRCWICCEPDSGARFFIFPLVWQKKKKKKENDKQHRDCRTASPRLLGEPAGGSQLVLKVKAMLSCPESILTFRIN